MNMIKSIFFIGVASVISLCSGMEPERPKEARWTDQVRNALLGKPSSVSFNLGELPQGMQHKITILISQYNGAASLKEAGQVIKALVKKSKDLNALINEPQFCFELIRVLAQKFKKSDEYVAKIIGTKEAQRRYYLQKNIYLLVVNDQWEQYKDQIKQLCANGADINFIYNSDMTLLMYAAEKLDLELFDFLIVQGADINFANNKGVTALMLAAQAGASWDLYLDFQKLFVAHQKDFNINQQDIDGNTALMYAIMAHEDTNVVQSLLDAGADPEIANFDGKTPLVYVEQFWDSSANKDAIIVFLRQAMEKKHAKK